MTLLSWAKKWGVSPAAIADLTIILRPSEIINKNPTPSSPTNAEAYIQQMVRIEASRRGVRLWRNNSGATYDLSGRLIRYGLANDSKAQSFKFKSGDLIGITPYEIKPKDIGHTLGVFTSYEIKKKGWKYAGNGREVAQNAWRCLINSLGGIAKFITKIEDL
jgi:hypothetical protein